VQTLSIQQNQRLVGGQVARAFGEEVEPDMRRPTEDSGIKRLFGGNPADFNFKRHNFASN
jgi:hypothetical protein